MTFRERVEHFVPTVEDSPRLDGWLTAGARLLISLLPESILPNYATTITDSGSGISISGYRFVAAHKSNFGAPLVDAGLQGQMATSGSIYYATADSPRCFIKENKAFVVPSGGTVDVVAYPTVIGKDSTISTFPEWLLHGVALYAAVQAAVSSIKDDLDSLNDVTEDLGTAMTIDLAAEITILKGYIGTNHDIELASAKAQEIGVRLAEFSAETNAALELYKTRAANAIQKAQNQLPLVKVLRDELQSLIAGLMQTSGGARQ